MTTITLHITMDLLDFNDLGGGRAKSDYIWEINLKVEWLNAKF